MKKILKINLELIINTDTEKSKEELLEEARKMMIEDGLNEYINEDNVTILDSGSEHPFDKR